MSNACARCNRPATSRTPATRRSCDSKPTTVHFSERLAEATGTIDELTDFRAQAIARLAAQHEEITRLRQAADEDARTSITRLPRRNAVIGPC